MWKTAEGVKKMQMPCTSGPNACWAHIRREFNTQGGTGCWGETLFQSGPHPLQGGAGVKGLGEKDLCLLPLLLTGECVHPSVDHGAASANILS